MEGFVPGGSSSVFLVRSRRGKETYALLSEDLGLALILNIDELLGAIGRVGDVQL